MGQLCALLLPTHTRAASSKISTVAGFDGFALAAMCSILQFHGSAFPDLEQTDVVQTTSSV